MTDTSWEELYEIACRELAMARDQRDRLEKALAEEIGRRNDLLTTLNQRVVQWRAEADRSKLLQGLDCAADLEALIGPLAVDAA